MSFISYSTEADVEIYLGDYIDEVKDFLKENPDVAKEALAFDLVEVVKTAKEQMNIGDWEYIVKPKIEAILKEN